MKKNVLFLLLGLFVTIAFTSCNKDDEEISVEAGIVGTWTVESTDVTLDGKSLETFVEEMMAELQEQMGDAFTDEMAEVYGEMFSNFDMSSEMEGVTIEFKENKTAIVTDEDGSESGTWSVSDKMLTVTFDNESQTFEVRSISSSRAALYSSIEEQLDASSTLKVESIINLKK